MNSAIKINIKSEIFPLLILMIIFVFSLYFYKHFAGSVPVHWNLSGKADSWSSPFKASFLLPVIALFVYLLFLILPKIDPKKERYKQFTKTYNIFKNIILLYLLAVYLLIGLNALGYSINIIVATTSLLGSLFIIIGNYMSKIKMNWFLGIRTPWTLSSENVWNKTHRLGAKIFVFTGIVFLFIGYVSSFWRIFIFIALGIIMITSTVFYSYYLYNKEQKNDNKQR